MANPRQESRAFAEQFNQQARRAADETAQGVRRAADAGEEVARTTEAATRALSEASERAAQVSADLFDRNTQAFQQMWQSGMQFASQMAERSTKQFARAMGLSGGQGEQAGEQSVGNFDAMLQSGKVFADAAQSISREWFDFARQRAEQNFEGMNALMRSRTPQDMMKAQADLLRDNLESMLQSGKQLAETSARIADEARRKMSEGMERSNHAA